MTRYIGFLFVLLTSAPAFAQHSAGRWPFPLTSDLTTTVPMPDSGTATDHSEWCARHHGRWHNNRCLTSTVSYDFAYETQRPRELRYVKMRLNYQLGPDQFCDWVSMLSRITERGPANDVMDTGFGVRIIHWNVASPDEEPWVVALFYSERESQLTIMAMTWREWNIEEWN